MPNIITDEANIFSFNSLPTENIPFDESALNIIIRDLAKEFPFKIVLFDKTIITFEKEIELYDFLLIDYYDTFNENLQRYRDQLEADRLQKIIDDENKKQEAILKAKNDKIIFDATKELEAKRLAFINTYGSATAEERREIDKEIFVKKAQERFEIKKHNDRVKIQLDNRVQNAIALYDKKYLTCEISLFDKLRNDASLYLSTGTQTVFFISYYNNNYTNKLTIDELAKKILLNADKRDSYISTLISDMKEDLKKHIKE